MAKRFTPPPKPRPAALSPQLIRAAIPKLERRIRDLRDFNVDALTDADYAGKITDLEARLDDTLVEIFGNDTADYERHRVHMIDGTPVIMFGPPVHIEERKANVRKGINDAIGTLETAVSLLKERLEDTGETAAFRAVNAYGGLDLHPEIARAASQLYRDGHYANAVESAVKALNGLVRLRSGLDIDGRPLMQKAFSSNSPILKFNDLSDQSKRDEQLGFMDMFCGAVSGLRNPRAHGFINDDPERALEFIAFVSLLAKLLDQAKT
jgi:uncharacterized protein (TIGR02391 family)